MLTVLIAKPLFLESSMISDPKVPINIAGDAELVDLIDRDFAIEDMPSGILWKKRRNQSQQELLLNLRYPSYDLFDTKITPTTTQDLLDILDTFANNEEQCIIASQNLHGMKLLYEVDAVRNLHDLDNTFVHIDGMPIVALCRLMGIEATRNHRVTLIDFIWPLLQKAEEKGWRIFYLGAKPDVLEAGLKKLREDFPKLQIMGKDGYFDLRDEQKNAEIADTIRAYGPDLILVGMGMARQEAWIIKNYKDLAPASFITVGACLEYVSGAVKTPPRWMGRVGLEWLFRLLENPGRFWQRYLVEPWLLLAHLVLHYAKAKRTNLDRESASAN